MTLQIKQNELIHTENSCKYTIPKIKEMLSTLVFKFEMYGMMKNSTIVWFYFQKND